jgi:putative ABC transport system ATP-binding protein
MPKPVLEMVNVSKLYDSETPFLALDRVSLGIEKGEFVSIVGRSGSGKSTLLHLLGCLDKPTSGEMYVDGRAVSEMSGDTVADIRRDTIGFVFQAFNLAPNLTVSQNVELPLMIRKVPKERRADVIRKGLSEVGLESKANNMPSQLSGGEKQRVAIARALANNPKIILADEPTGNLDSKTSREIMDRMEHLCRDHGITMVIVTHEHKLTEDADRIICITDGKIESDVKKRNRRGSR